MKIALCTGTINEHNEKLLKNSGYVLIWKDPTRNMARFDINEWINEFVSAFCDTHSENDDTFVIWSNDCDVIDHIVRLATIHLNVNDNGVQYIRRDGYLRKENSSYISPSEMVSRNWHIDSRYVIQ